MQEEEALPNQKEEVGVSLRRDEADREPLRCCLGSPEADSEQSSVGRRFIKECSRIHTCGRKGDEAGVGRGRS